LKYRPTLIVISQGQNFDGTHFVRLCRRLKLPYVLISQKASDLTWPRDRARAEIRLGFESAKRCFFVSNHNLKLTEDQIGTLLNNAEIVRNPYLVDRKTLPWPEDSAGLRLACVARLDVFEKGQDLLIRVLAKSAWKERDLTVSFYGRGFNQQALVELAKKMGVHKVAFMGHTNDVSGIWRDHHALFLTSRCEGLPLCLVEAMMSGRPAIVTDVGGNAEILEHEVTGFIAASPSETEIDIALERAWQRRHEWRKMGEIAAERIRELVPNAPEEMFAERLVEIAQAGPLHETANLISRHITTPNVQ